VGTLEWVGSALAVALTLGLTVVFAHGLHGQWEAMRIRRRVLLSALLVEFVLLVALIAVERFVTSASWTWVAGAVLVAAGFATERELKRTRRPPTAS
jgi:hypothetical protein